MGLWAAIAQFTYCGTPQLRLQTTKFITTVISLTCCIYSHHLTANYVSKNSQGQVANCRIRQLFGGLYSPIFAL